MSRIVFAAKNSWTTFSHEHTIICRQLFAGHVVSSRPMKRKKHLHRMIKWVSQLRRFPPIPYPFNFARRCWWGKNFCKSFSRAVHAVLSRCIRAWTSGLRHQHVQPGKMTDKNSASDQAEQQGHVRRNLHNLFFQSCRSSLPGFLRWAVTLRFILPTS